MTLHKVVMEGTRVCRGCERELPVAEFYRQKNGPGGRRSRCKDCQREWYDPERARRYSLESRRRNRDAINAKSRVYSRENREKKRAQLRVFFACKRGELTRPEACEWCGVVTPDLHGHHEDYSRPLDVVWVCPGCHLAHHKKLKEVA